MKRLLFKIIRLSLALAVSAGVLFLNCAFTVKLPKGVTVNGVAVGGLSFKSAKTAVREKIVGELKDKRLRISSIDKVYEFAYPEINFADGLDLMLPSIKSAGDYTVPVGYYLNGMTEIVDAICEVVYEPAEEPYAQFNRSGVPFTYFDGYDGIACDREKLICDINRSLECGFDGEGDFAGVKVCTIAQYRQVSPQTVGEWTQKLCSFTTYFDGENADRTANIRLAGEKINGTVVGAGEIFSFNEVVGERTAENGFRQAKIIEDGQFVMGYGGGVCQVSTTLYNAALLSGLEITEYHPHSLQVSYVSPSRDAMVSGNYFDLKFRNNRLTPIYVRVNGTLNSVTCTVYGPSDGYTYSFVSKVTEVLPRPDAVTCEGDEDRVIYGRDGTASEGYLVKEADGVRTETLIRSDRYSAVADRIEKKRPSAEEKSS